MPTPALEVLTAAPVPFDPDGTLRMDVFTAMLTRVSRHTQGAFVNGTTAEFPALDDAERADLLEAAVAVLGHDNVVAHVGAPSLRQVLRHADAAVALGIHRIASLTPYYLPCDFARTHHFFEAIASRFAGVDVFVYLFPERSGLEVSPEELARLTSIDGIAGAKLSGRPNDQFARYAQLAAPGSRIYSGDDGSYPTVANAGGSGVVSGVSAAFPELFGELTKALTAAPPDAAAVHAAQAHVTAAVAAAGSNITRLKYALSRRYDEMWAARMPLPTLEDASKEDIDALIASVPAS
jgi:4-hydroxy-tetrahydrodipicolinate synthase